MKSHIPVHVIDTMGWPPAAEDTNCEWLGYKIVLSQQNKVKCMYIPAEGLIWHYRSASIPCLFIPPPLKSSLCSTIIFWSFIYIMKGKKLLSFICQFHIKSRWSPEYHVQITPISHHIQLIAHHIHIKPYHAYVTHITVISCYITFVSNVILIGPYHVHTTHITPTSLPYHCHITSHHFYIKSFSRVNITNITGRSRL